MDLLFTILLYALVWGSIYLLVSIGFSLICGVLRIFHLGYGVTFVLSGYLVWVFTNRIGLGMIPAIVLMLVVQIILAILVFYKSIFARYIEEEELLLTLSVLIFMVVENLINYLFPLTQGVNIPTALATGTAKIGTVLIPKQMIAAAVVGVLVTAIYVAIFTQTRVGLIMRSMSQSIRAARLMGVDTNKMYYLAMALAVIPPSIAPLVTIPFWGMEPFMGMPLFMTAIMISILGGLGNLKGTIIASYIIGLIHASVSFLYASRFMELVALVIVLVVMIFKQGGILAEERLW